MDRIKTYVMGMGYGFEKALEGLDKEVAEDPDLRGVEIKSVEDRYFIVAGKTHNSARQGDEECLSRIVIYRREQK